MFAIHQIIKININILGIGVMVSTTDFDSVCRGSNPLSLTINSVNICGEEQCSSRDGNAFVELFNPFPMRLQLNWQSTALEPQFFILILILNFKIFELYLNKLKFENYEMG